MTTYKDSIGRYITELYAGQDEALLRASEDSSKQSRLPLNIQAEEGRFLQVLARACGATKALEFGTLGGYSGIWIARGLAPGGKLITLEKDPQRADLARGHFMAARVADQVEVRVGDAHSMLPSLSADGPFDFVFIDAEKPGYPIYFAWALEHTRLGGLIVAHNTLRGGKVLGEGDADENTILMRAFNKSVASESRVLSTIYPAGDGMLLAVKIG